jgi:KDO2-lipid IV(A) lauroyltransferase
VAAEGVKPPLLKRLRRELRVRALLFVLPLLHRLPYGPATALGAAIGWLGYFASAKQRRLTLEHLAIAFPEKPEAERKRIARSCFAHLGRAAVESALADRLRIEDEVQLDPRSEQVVRDAHAQGKGVLVVTAHVGNWELFARRICKVGPPCATVAKEQHDPRLTKLLEESRRQAGLTLFWRGSAGSARDMLKFLKNGGMVGVLIDQDTRVAGHFVPFFGRPAFTPRAAGDFAARLDAPLLVGITQRLAPRLHRMQIRSIDVPRTGDRDADSLALTAAATREIEAAIRARPEQWVWMHPRWRTESVDFSAETAS